MATITYPNPTAEQTEGVQYALKQRNAELAALSPPQGPLTVNQFMTARVEELIASMVEARRSDRKKRLRDKFASLTLGEQDALMAQLNIPTT